MASFASSATTCGARKHAWTNNCQIRFRPPPRVAHATRLDQKKKSRWKQWPALLPFATTGGAHKLPGPIHILSSIILTVWQLGIQFLVQVKRSWKDKTKKNQAKSWLIETKSILQWFMQGRCDYQAVRDITRWFEPTWSIRIYAYVVIHIIFCVAE